MPRRSRVRMVLFALGYLAIVALCGWDRWYLGLIPAILIPVVLCFYGSLVVAADADRRMDRWLARHAHPPQSKAL